jgi:hypothetical protein
MKRGTVTAVDLNQADGRNPTIAKYKGFELVSNPPASEHWNEKI